MSKRGRGRSRAPVRHETRAARSRREALKKAGIWIFIVLFALSIGGGLLAFAVRK